MYQGHFWSHIILDNGRIVAVKSKWSVGILMCIIHVYDIQTDTTVLNLVISHKLIVWPDSPQS